MRYHIFSKTKDGHYVKEFFDCDANSAKEALDKFFREAIVEEADKPLFIATTNPNYANEH